MLVSCPVSDAFTSHKYGGSNLAMTGLNYAALALSRTRNVSGESRGSLGSVEAELSPVAHGSYLWPLRVSGPPATSLAMASPGSSNSSISSHVAESLMDSSPNCIQMFNNQSPKTLQKNGGHSGVNSTRYKTERCRPFDETGYCKYGDKCQFAHGDHQLRAVPRHPKYKTELCRTFHTTGICPYGPRCHFIHSENEMKLVEITQMKAQYAQQQMAQEMASQVAHWQLASLGNAQSPFVGPNLRAMLAFPPTANPATNQAYWAYVNSNAMGQSFGAGPLASEASLPTPFVPPLTSSDTLGSSGESPCNSAASSPVTSPLFTWAQLQSSNETLSPVYSTPTIGAALSFATSNYQMKDINSEDPSSKQDLPTDIYMLLKEGLVLKPILDLNANFEKMTVSSIDSTSNGDAIVSPGAETTILKLLTPSLSPPPPGVYPSVNSNKTSSLVAGKSTDCSSKSDQHCESVLGATDMLLPSLITAPQTPDCEGKGVSWIRTMRLPVFSRLASAELC